jgi:hypothetical protein
MPGRLSISEERQSYLKRLGYPELHSSNFLDLDLLSSSGNSCDEEGFERYYIPHSLNYRFPSPWPIIMAEDVILMVRIKKVLQTLSFTGHRSSIHLRILSALNLLQHTVSKDTMMRLVCLSILLTL